jgi:hypothetical protein
MRSPLDTIEFRLQEFIEKTIFFFPWNNRQSLFAHLLVEAVARTLIEDAAGRISLANDYAIIANPDLILPWQNNPIFLSDLSKVLLEAAADVGMAFYSAPAFQLVADPSVPPGAFRIEPMETSPTIEDTGVMSITGQDKKAAGDTLPVNAFLILDGNQIYPLRLSVVKIGRRLENNLVIDDPRISRNHALLRANNGKYMLCDLNSTGGTYVNGQRITQQPLRPGDVISLAGVSIIYGEESGSNPYSSDGSTTSILPPHSGKS